MRTDGGEKGTASKQEGPREKEEEHWLCMRIYLQNACKQGFRRSRDRRYATLLPHRRVSRGGGGTKKEIACKKKKNIKMKAVYRKKLFAEKKQMGEHTQKDTFF